MPRTVPNDKRELAKRLIRQGLTTRDIALRAGIGVGTVTRMKNDMGLGATNGRGRPRRGLPKAQPVPETEPPAPRTPSAAALRLAEFDPIVRRALAPSKQENDDDC